MNSQLTQRLVERFPVLYQDYHSPMTQTCMCCGFDHGDGWFEIVAAQPGHRRRVGLLVAAEARVPGEERIFPQLSPVRDDKRKQEGSGTKEDPYRWVVVKAPRDCLARMAWKLFPPPRFEIIAVGPRSSSVSGSRHVRWPHAGLAAVQVEEKFGTLRFYCGRMEAIDKYVRLAERLSSVTCEDCGKLGNANDSGWIRTQCEACRKNWLASR